MIVLGSTEWVETDMAYYGGEKWARSTEGNSWKLDGAMCVNGRLPSAIDDGSTDYLPRAVRPGIQIEPGCLETKPLCRCEGTNMFTHTDTRWWIITGSTILLELEMNTVQRKRKLELEGRNVYMWGTQCCGEWWSNRSFTNRGET